MKIRLVWIAAALLCAAAAAATTSRKLEDDDNDDDVQGDLLCNIFLLFSATPYAGLVSTIVLFPVFAVYLAFCTLVAAFGIPIIGLDCKACGFANEAGIAPACLSSVLDMQREISYGVAEMELCPDTELVLKWPLDFESSGGVELLTILCSSNSSVKFCDVFENGDKISTECGVLQSDPNDPDCA